MMNKHAIALAGCAVLLCGIGCQGSSEGDVAAAQKAAAAAPKSVDQLPQEMPPQAKAAAAAAMGEAQARQAEAQDPARVRAMQEMRRQAGR